MARKPKRQKPNKKTPPAASTCRDCGQVCRIPRYEFFKANRPRCTRCGATLEYGGSWVGSR